VPVFRKPSFAYDDDVDRELAALRIYPERPDRLWGAGTATDRKPFRSYVRYHLSDHLPVRMEMRT
jgi:hypothetical protein